MKIYCNRDKINPHDFTRYVGKDIWILVYDFYRQMRCFIRVVEDLGTHIRYNRVYWAAIDFDYLDKKKSCSDELINEILTDTYTSIPLNFTIIEPIEIFTTDEIVELLKRGYDE